MSRHAEPIHKVSFWAISAVLIGACFAFFFLFFSTIHPVYLLHVDDWTYISYWRECLPLWGNWNPTRVFPEILMPICGGFAAFVINPLVEDYFYALMLTFAGAITVFVTGYVLCFYVYLTNRCKATRPVAMMLCVLFVALHFLVFRCSSHENVHLFWSSSITNYSYYAIPNLLCCSLVLLHSAGLIQDGSPLCKSPLHIGVLLVLVYMALLSNLFSSIILAAYCMGALSYELIRAVHTRIAVSVVLKKNYPLVGVICAWAAVQVCEANGGRSSVAGVVNDSPFTERLVQVLRSAWSVRGSINKVVLAIMLLLFTCGIILFLIRKSQASADWLKACLTHLVGSFVTLGYECLLCAASMPEYIVRPDVLFGTFFFLFMTSMTILARLLDGNRLAEVSLPLLVLILASFANTSGKTFADPNELGVSSAVVRAIDDDILAQVEAACADGSSSVTVLIPVFHVADNAPITEYGGDRASTTLFAHGITDRPIEITFLPSETKNMEFAVGGAGTGDDEIHRVGLV